MVSVDTRYKATPKSSNLEFEYIYKGVYTHLYCCGYSEKIWANEYPNISNVWRPVIFINRTTLFKLKIKLCCFWKRWKNISSFIRFNCLQNFINWKNSSFFICIARIEMKIGFGRRDVYMYRQPISSTKLNYLIIATSKQLSQIRIINFETLCNLLHIRMCCFTIR